MAADFSTPIQNAWARTRAMLIDGFDPAKYLVLGFSAFLAILVDGATDSQAYAWSTRSGPLSGAFGMGGLVWSGFEWDSVAWLWLGPMLGCSMIVAIALLYVGAHGKMIFLENTVYDRAAIVEPWKRLDGVSTSLFFWMLGFVAVASVVFMALGTPWLFLIAGLDDMEGVSAALVGILAVGGGMILAILGLIFAFVWFLMSHFVVPLLYRDGGTARAAWSKFLPLFRQNLGNFLIYGVLYLCFRILLSTVLLLLTVATCCLLGIVMMIPYLSTLVVLPALVFIRLLSLEFLAQFGPDFGIEPLV